MKKWFGAILVLCLCLTSCVVLEQSTLITDDNGYVHRTKYYLNDKRGRDYFPIKIAAPGVREFIFDPKISAWAAYDEDGNRILTGSGSAGKDSCDESIDESCRTVTGNFRIYNKKGEDCRSGEYPVDTKGGARMPWCMYFYRGYTIHAAYEVPDHPSSHGCVRVLPSAAKWLNEDFLKLGSKVVILAYPDENGVNRPEVKPTVHRGWFF